MSVGRHEYHFTAIKKFIVFVIKTINNWAWREAKVSTLQGECVTSRKYDFHEMITSR